MKLGLLKIQLCSSYSEADNQAQISVHPEWGSIITTPGENSLHQNNFRNWLSCSNRNRGTCEGVGL